MFLNFVSIINLSIFVAVNKTIFFTLKTDTYLKT